MTLPQTELEQLLNIKPRSDLNRQTLESDMVENARPDTSLAEGIEAAERLDYERMIGL